MSLFSELKRRNVLRVAIAYLAACWLRIQVVERLFPIFGLSDALLRLVVIVLIIGFPTIIIFSWVYELTPEGLKLESDVERSESVIHHTGNVKGLGPNVELDLLNTGNLTLTISDPNGLTDLDPSSLRMAFDGVEFPPILLVQVMTIRKLTSTSVSLTLGGNLPPNLLFHLAVSVKDKTGYRSGQTRVR